MAKVKNFKGKNKGNSVPPKSKQMKPNKPVINKKVKEVEVNKVNVKPANNKVNNKAVNNNVSNKVNNKPVNNKPQVAKNETVGNKIAKIQPNKKEVLKKEVALKEKEVLSKPKASEPKPTEDSDDEIDIEESEDDIDESDIEMSDDGASDSEMDTSDMEKMILNGSDDSDIEEIDSDGEIAYNEDDDVDSSDEEVTTEQSQPKEAEKVTAKKEISKPTPVTKVEKKEAQKVAATKVDTVAKQKEAPKQVAPKMTPVVTEVKVETVVKTEAPKVTAAKVEATNKAKEVKDSKPIDSDSPAAKILAEMNKRKNALSSCSIHVRNVGSNVTADALSSLLENVVNVNLPGKIRGGKLCNRGYGFVRLVTPSDAAKAITTITGTVLDGKSLIGSPFVCKRVYDDHTHIDFSRVLLTAMTTADRTAAIAAILGNGVTVTKVDKVTYQAVFADKCAAKVIFDQQSITVDGESVQTNFLYNFKETFDNSVIPVAKETVVVPETVVKAGVKRGKPQDYTEVAVVKKAKVEPTKKQQPIKVAEKKIQPVKTVQQKEQPIKIVEKQEQPTKVAEKKQQPMKTEVQKKKPVKAEVQKKQAVEMKNVNVVEEKKKPFLKSPQINKGNKKQAGKK